MPGNPPKAAGNVGGYPAASVAGKAPVGILRQGRLLWPEGELLNGNAVTHGLQKNAGSRSHSATKLNVSCVAAPSPPLSPDLTPRMPWNCFSPGGPSSSALRVAQLPAPIRPGTIPIQYQVGRGCGVPFGTERAATESVKIALFLQCAKIKIS